MTVFTVTQLIFYPEFRATFHDKPHEISRDTFFFYLLWLGGDGAQLVGLYLSAHPLFTAIVLNYCIGVLELIMLFVLAFYAGYFPCFIPASYRRATTGEGVAEIVETGHTRFKKGASAALVRSHAAFLGAQPADSAGPPGSARLPSELDDSASTKGMAGSKKGRRKLSLLRRVEMPFVVVFAFVAAFVLWGAIDVRVRNSKDDEAPSSFPTDKRGVIAYVLLILGAIGWITPRVLNIMRSIKRKLPEGISLYGIITMASAHFFNILSVLIINHTGESFIGQAPYILNSVFCLTLDCLRFYLKHRYAGNVRDGGRHPFDNDKEFWQRHNKNKGRTGPSYLETRDYLGGLASSDDEQHLVPALPAAGSRRGSVRHPSVGSHGHPVPHDHSSSHSSLAYSDSEASHSASSEPPVGDHKDQARELADHARELMSHLEARREAALAGEQKFERQYAVRGSDKRSIAKLFTGAKWLDVQEQEDAQVLADVRATIRQVDPRLVLVQERLWKDYDKLVGEEKELRKLRRKRHEKVETTPKEINGIDFEERGTPDVALHHPATRRAAA
ncbi:hypothetical protein JCM10213_008962 [Rhodosporidiobolus nylandii]